MPFDALSALGALAPNTVKALDANLVFQFFAVFSRFECALKRSDFLKVSKTKGAEPH